MDDSIISSFGARFYRAWRSYEFNEEMEEKHYYSIPIIAVLWCQIFVLAIVLIVGYTIVVRKAQKLNQKRGRFKTKDVQRSRKALNISLLLDMMKDYQRIKLNYDMVSLIRNV